MILCSLVHSTSRGSSTGELRERLMSLREQQLRRKCIKDAGLFGKKPLLSLDDDNNNRSVTPPEDLNISPWSGASR